MVVMVAMAFSVVLVAPAALPMQQAQGPQRMEAMAVLAAVALTQVVTEVLVATHGSMDLQQVVHWLETAVTEVTAQMLAGLVVLRVMRPLLVAERLRTGLLARLELQLTQVR